MSVSRHPVALRLERQVGGATRLLATVMALPLLDGIFPALVVAGALTVPFGILETGLLIFGGSATVAVILAEMEADRRQQIRSILLLGAVLIPAAALEAAVAPTIYNLLDPAIFERFAGLVILTVAARTASAQVGEYLPRPAIIIGLGLVASFQPAGAAVAFVADPWLIARAAAAAGVGVGFALAVAALGPQLRGSVDLDRFRFGSAVALGMLALSVLGLMPTDAPVALGVLGVTAVFSLDVGGESEGDYAPDSLLDATVTDGGDGASDADSADADEDEDEEETVDDSRYGISADESRAPWL